MEQRLAEKRKREALIAKKLFIGGCFLLPWLWILSVWYHRKVLFASQVENRELKKCKCHSLLPTTFL